MTGGGAAIGAHGMVSQKENELFIEDNVIEFNMAQRGAGAVRLHVRGKGRILRNRIRHNGKTSIACFVLHGVRIEDNVITDTMGGNAISGWNAWPGVKILNNEIARTPSGSGIWFEESEGYIVGNIITENVNSHGAGLCLDGAWEVVNNVIAHNTATGTEKGGGGMFLAWGGNCKIVNNTLVGNIAAVDGGAISAPKAHPTIVNSILWNNTAPGGVQIFGDDCTVEYSNVMGGHSGTGNIDADPLFVDSADSDFHLTYTSPCKDSGDDTAVMDLFDFESDPRIAYGAVDMGADEFYTHLYYTGEAAIGKSIEGKFVGLPGTSLVGLFFGMGILDPPLPTPWGHFHLLNPWSPVLMEPIPADGVLVFPATIPASPPAPYDLPMQALIGLDPDSLTNLCVLEVR
jgi:hypothetical protein